MTGARKHSSVSIAAAKYGYLRNAVNTNRLWPGARVRLRSSGRRDGANSKERSNGQTSDCLAEETLTYLAIFGAGPPLDKDG